jgi:multicomponent Na+:H+ antiporter subunit D
MTYLTLIWILLPFFTAFTVYLLPKLARYLALPVAFSAIAYAVVLWTARSPFELTLLNNFGVTLLADRLSSEFILTNGLVTTAVILYCWQRDKSAFFYSQVLILYGSVNSAFIIGDLISLYVALEVLSMSAFLLIAYPRSDRAIWVAMRYFFVSNAVLLFYLMGVMLVYEAHDSFRFEGLDDATPEAIALILLGLLTKGGIFISGLWLPSTNAEAETPVAALLCGIVEKAAIFPLLRIAILSERLAPIILSFGVATALLGVGFAIFETDTKRTLAFSTLSQLGWIMVAPAVGGSYALAHGLAKTTLFLCAGELPSRKFKDLQQTTINFWLWLPIAIASFSMMGMPLLMGYGAKALTLGNLLPSTNALMTLAAIGTVIVYGKFVFLQPVEKVALSLDILLPVLLLSMILIGGSFAYREIYTFAYLLKALAVMTIGGLLYIAIARYLDRPLPRTLEGFDHLIGMMGIVLVLLYWMGLP